MYVWTYKTTQDQLKREGHGPFWEKPKSHTNSKPCSSARLPFSSRNLGEVVKKKKKKPAKNLPHPSQITNPMLKQPEAESAAASIFSFTRPAAGAGEPMGLTWNWSRNMGLLAARGVREGCQTINRLIVVVMVRIWRCCTRTRITINKRIPKNPHDPKSHKKNR